MSQILNIPIGHVYPDKDQPRKRINDSEIKGLSDNIKAEGIINPIEIDEDHIIITGERRWRAAKLAGLETVPCFYNNLSGKERFKHQVSENIHHNTMSELDTARSLDRLLKDYDLLPPGDSKKGSGGWNDKGITWLSSEMGKSRAYIEEKLDLLKQPADFQEAADKKEVSTSMIRAIKRIPEKYKDKVRKKILNKDIGSRDGALELSTALREHPEKTDELLNQSYRDMSTAQMIKKINKIAPTERVEAQETLEQELEAGMEIARKANDLVKAMKKTPIQGISKTNFPLVLLALAQLNTKLQEYVSGQELPKQIN